ncbi:MAG: hypothetical protein KAR13_19905 [Desulfobulbaceae bacterium]|nr:hypothetical protein [Desulfobulbaceae bacterium]
MELTRERIIEFMHQYYEEYGKCTADPNRVNNMKAYYGPGCKITQYITPRMTIDRDDFIPLIGKHPHITETLTPVKMIIDIEQKNIACLIRAELTTVETGTVREWFFLATYELDVNEDDALRIIDFEVMAEGPAPGEPTLLEVLGVEAFSVD